MKMQEGKILASIILTLLTMGFNGCTYEGLIDEPETPGQHPTNIAIDKLIVEKRSAYSDGFFVERAQINGQQYFIFKYCCPLCNELVETYFEDGELACTFSANREVATENCFFKLSDMESFSTYWQPKVFNCPYW